MNAAGSVIVAGLVATALVVAQYVLPATPLYHDWRYATLLVLIALPLVRACRPRRGERDGRLGLAAFGALIVVAAGLWSGLAGADTETIAGAPGTTVPVPALHLSAQFGVVSDAALAAGTATVALRRGTESIDLGPAPRFLGGSVFYTQPRVAARIDARDARGNHLTVTQPQNATFLSDVLLFRSEQAIRDQKLPLDTFATPAAHRVVRALYFTAPQLAAFRHGAAPGAPALVLSAADDAGRPMGIALAGSRETTEVAGLKIRATLGHYPALAVAAAPYPAAVGGGFGIFGAALLWRLTSRGTVRRVLDADLT